MLNLSHSLNQFLNINLKRCAYDLDFQYTKASYSVYEWEDNKRQAMWNLIGNIFKREEDSLVSSGSLFDATSKVAFMLSDGIVSLAS